MEPVAQRFQHVEHEVQRMDDMSLALLKRLVKTFPHGVTLKDGTFRSAFCTEKPHSIVHSGDNYRIMGRCKNYNTVDYSSGETFF